LTAETRDTRGAKPAHTSAPILREACALEAAEQGGMTLEEIASRFALTRERVRQIELSALRKLERQLGRDAWTDADPAHQTSKAA
jgi:DNA-directed RNA polymerase sigma subunit (sigma70/sigma32)